MSVSATACATPPVAGECFHCGETLGGVAHFFVRVNGTEQPMCCAGCAAVAETIVASGLADYYATRDARPATPAEQGAAARAVLAFAAPSLERALTRDCGSDEREAVLLVEGIRCGSCAWLIERRVRQLPGVTDAGLNYATHRLGVRWKTGAVALADIVRNIAELGYPATPFDPARQQALAAGARRRSLKKLAVASLGMMQVMMLALPAYLAGPGEMPPDLDRLLRWAALLVTLPVLGYSGSEFFTAAWRGLRHRHLSMDLPVAIGLAAAFAASVWATVSGRGAVYFDSVAMFVFLLLGTRHLEQRVQWRAGDALERLTALLPRAAQRVVSTGAQERIETVPLSDLRVGDVLLIAAGERLPVDGRVLSGLTECDESLVTGESRLVPKRLGDAVMAGAVNVASPVTVRAAKVGVDTTVAHVRRLMERALAEKPRVARLADRAAGWFTAGLLVTVLVAGAVWWLVEPARALPVAIALLVITCPCALSLAAPTALTAASWRLAGFGMVPTRGGAIETLAAVTDLVFDKTGTLTLGQPAVQRITLLRAATETRALALAAALEVASEHPLGKALRARGGSCLAASDVRNHAGAGVEGTVDGRRLRIGTAEFVSGIAGMMPPLQIHHGVTVVALGDENGWLATFEFDDTLRPEAPATVRQLEALGIRIHLLSGDSPAMAARIATLAAIGRGRGGASPQAKLDYVRGLQADGAVVAMVGDGINDAPGLGGAQVSIAMGSGTDVAQSAADFVLLAGDLGAIPKAIAVARKARALVRQNLGWALAYNLVAVPLAALGLVTPLSAAVGMSASSLLVILNALRVAPASRARPAGAA